ncbi:chorismate mutase [Buchnera aphidicola]|uniref:Bifunctional chorismate mutase/prephenate dehydratase n=1 Tax=Buchnera aphidicola (Artemisaphis artemisicola) TaxID=1241836 RepID=A0A4D6XN12_9GAMM|nr:chorismate mutase [Buchnera aphidicola]QCI16060.1 chorismate mutase [Buchnera aphidicola (Artemisaphis artemisicola)]
MPNNNYLLAFRDEINNIDENIVQLLAKRKNLVLKIAKSKIKNNQAIRDKEREKKILEKLILLGKKYYLEPEYITRLFKLIIEESVLTQKEMLKKFYKANKSILNRVSFLGPKGSYSHIAACKYADKNFQTYIKNECSTFEEVILSVEGNQSDYAILPIENTCSGFIYEVIHLLKKTQLFIIGEINMIINHCLLGVEKIQLEKIKTVYSHPQPFQQCSNFIEKFPGWKIKHTKSTADAMKIIDKYNDATKVALGSEIGSKIYGLKILSKNLSNINKNITKFIVLGRNPIKFYENSQNKTILMCSIENKSEILEQVRFLLKKRKIIMNKLIHLKDKKNLSKEIIYIDIEENLSSPIMKNAIQKIKKITNYMKILGCYPISNTNSIIK